MHKVYILYIITLDLSLFKNIPACLQTVLLKQGNLQHFHKSELVGGGGDVVWVIKEGNMRLKLDMFEQMSLSVTT